MQIVNMREAKTHLSRLVRDAENGEPFIISKAGKPVVKVISVNALESNTERRLGFMVGQISVPADFDRMGSAEIVTLFEDG
jgi:prevent-host-death family protein